MKILTYGNTMEFIKKKIKILYKWFENYMSRIFLFILFCSIIYNGKSISFEDIVDVIEIVFFIIYLLVSTKEWLVKRSIRKLQMKVSCKLDEILSDNVLDDFFNNIKNKSEGKSKVKLHAIFYMMFSLLLVDRLLELKNNNLKSK